MPVTRAQLMQRFADLGIPAPTVEHAPVFTVEEAKRLRGELPGGHCKNLFLKNKKGRLWLLVCLEDRQVDLKALEKYLGAGRLSFGKPELLWEVLGVEPGSVTPFALINDTETKVQVVLDAAMMKEEALHYHPLENGATTRVTPTELERFIAACGHEPLILDLNALPQKQP
jgi:Ala-tRNA(Pro) deacylase